MDLNWENHLIDLIEIARTGFANIAIQTHRKKKSDMKQCVFRFTGASQRVDGYSVSSYSATPTKK